jgi:PEGA domain-containing protein
VALVLAIDPDHNQAKALGRLTRELRGHDIVVAGSCDEALATIDRRIPDLVLFPLSLAASEEATLLSRLRGLSGEDPAQTLTIPLLAAEDRDASAEAARWFYWFKPRSQNSIESAEHGAFARDLRICLERERSRQREHPNVEVKPNGETHVRRLNGAAAARLAKNGAACAGTVIRAIARSLVLIWRGLRSLGSVRVPGTRWAWYVTPAFVLAVGVTVKVGIPEGLSWPNRESKPGFAELRSVPDGSDVLVDGTKVGVTPVTASLTAGTHEVEFRYRGASRIVSLDIAAGEHTLLRMDWKKSPTAHLRVMSDPAGAVVTVDGKNRGAAPLTIDDLSAGQHVIVFTHDSGSIRRTVRLKPNETASITGSIYSGWLALFAPIDLQISEGAEILTLDEHNRVLLSPGHHVLQLANRTYGYRGSQEIDVRPGEITVVSLTLPKTSVSVTATAPAQVWIDGNEVGETPIADLPVDIGTREFVLKNPTLGERHVTAAATVKPLRVDVDFTKP